MKETNKDIRKEVQKYYGEILQTNKDLKTSACCTAAGFPSYLKDIISEIHPEVREKYYGCGVVAPDALQGKTILDLGSGSGHDCYILSKLVGPSGRVIGVDMTDEQLEVANKYLEYHQKKFGYSLPNVEFKKGFIEELGALNLKDNSIDIVVSNCVLNLSTRKDQVLKGIFKLLKPGGEFYFSDVYSDRRIPTHLVNDAILYGECLSGALYVQDFIRLARTTGFTDPRVVKNTPLNIQEEKLKTKIGPINFFSTTYRLFKIEGLEDLCEDYGQSVVYKGHLEHSPNQFILDDHHCFETGKQHLVCGNTFLMLSKTRYKEYFEFYGDFHQHFGLFLDCGPKAANSEDKLDNSLSCC